MTTQTEQALLRSAAYDALSLAFLYPDEETGQALAAKLRPLAAGAAALPWPKVSAAAHAAIAILETFSPRDLEEAFLALFGHTVPADCPPYEAEYNQSHLFQKSRALADVAGYYAAFGVSPNAGFKDRQDHLSMETAFMALLALKEAYALSQGHGEEAVAVCRRAQEGFLAGHLGAWSKTFVQRLARKSGPDNPYLFFAQLLDAFMDEEFAAFRLPPVQQPAAASAGSGGDKTAPAAVAARALRGDDDGSF